MPAAPKATNASISQADVARVDKCTTLVAVLRMRAATSPDRIVYRFLTGETKSELRITYRELDRRARAMASVISTRAARGDRALLLIPPSLDYVAAYFGCLYAGVIAVPAYPPNPRRPDPRVPAIVLDCSPTVGLTTGALLAKLEQWRGGGEQLAAVDWIA